MKKTALILLFSLSVSLGFSQSRKIDVPTNRFADTTIFYKKHYKKISGLGLSNLYYKHDSVSFRFWTDRHLLDFKIGQNGKIYCDLFSFVLFIPGKGGASRYHYSKIELEEKVATYLWMKMDSLGIVKMPDESKIPGERGYVIIDGYTCITELSTDSVYKFCTFSTPEAHHDSFKEAKNMSDFLKIVEETIGLRNRFHILLDNKPYDGFCIIEDFR